MALMTELINSEPSSFEGAAQHDMWQEAMVEEYDSIMKNQAWEVVPRPEGKKVVGSRCIGMYRDRYRHRAHVLMVRGIQVDRILQSLT